MRRFQLAAITCLQGAVACGSYETSEPNVVGDAGASSTDAAVVIDTPVAPSDPSKTCVPRPPADWQGPVILSEGSGSSLPAPPSCPTGYQNAFDAFSALVAPDADCKCECAPETGGSCMAKLVAFKDKSCLSPCDAAGTGINLGPACAPISTSCYSAKATSTYAPGTCAPKVGAKTKLPTTWGTQARMCNAVVTSDAGCAPDRTAIPTASLPFLTNTYCVARTGEDSCPDVYPRKRVYYSGITDTRDCECTCAAPTGGGCSGSVNLTDNATTCTGGLKQLPTDSSCGFANSAGANYTPAVKAGSCAPQSKPQGNASPTSATTVCCTR